MKYFDQNNEIKVGSRVLSLFLDCLDCHLLESISAKIQPTLQISIDWERMQHENSFRMILCSVKTLVYPFVLSMMKNILLKILCSVKTLVYPFELSMI